MRVKHVSKFSLLCLILTAVVYFSPKAKKALTKGDHADSDTVDNRQYSTHVSSSVGTKSFKGNGQELSTEHVKSKIPKIVHFVFGMERGAVFGLVQYLSVASASRVLRPEIIYVHYVHLPTGFFWDLLGSVVIPRRIEEINSVFGLPVIHYAHKADVARMRALMEYGGIYLDLDVVSLSSFDHLLNHDFVMGQEGKDGQIGLCNAVILASKESRFLKTWFESYTTFNSSIWSYHSVILPKELAVKYPTEITILDHRSFFWPIWDRDGLNLMYKSHEYDYKSNLGVHLWNSVARKRHTKEMTMIWLLQNRSSLLSKLDVYLPTPLFSVIIRCYNQRHYIDEVINSVTAQSWPLWEIIVVDDSSPDGCGRYVTDAIAPVLNKHAARQMIKVLHTLGPVGVSQSRNFGIAAAVGSWICILEADDRIGADYFLKAERALTLNPDINIIYSNQQNFQDSKVLWDVPVYHAQKALTYSPFPSMTLYPRKLWDMVHGYSSALPYGNEDYDFWMLLMEVGVRGRKLEGVDTYYRYKLRSKMRDSEQHVDVEHAMMYTRHLSLISLDTIFTAHRDIGNMLRDTYSLIKEQLGSARTSLRDNVFLNFWLGLYEQQQGSKTAAIQYYKWAISANKSRIQWQPAYYYATLLCESDSTEGRQLLKRTISNYPELRIRREVLHTLNSCVGYNVTLAPIA